MPPHVRWRATTLQSLASRRHRACLNVTKYLRQHHSDPLQRGRVAVLRRYATAASSAPTEHPIVYSTQTEKDDALVKSYDAGRHSLKDIAHKTQSTLAAIQELRIEDSKAVEQFATACEYLLRSESEEDPALRISVYGSDESSAASKLVTALLDDPLSSNEVLRQVIGERMLGDRVGSLNAPHRFTSSDTPNDATCLPSSFFTRFKNPVILEDLSTSPSNRLTSILTADVPVFAYSPFIPTQSAINFFHRNPNALLVVDGGLDRSSSSVQSFCTRLASQLGCHPSRVLIVNSARALRGIEVLRTAASGAGSARAVAQYQEDVLASHLPQLITALTDTAKKGKAALRLDAALALAEQVTVVGRANVQLRTRDADVVRKMVSSLQEAVLETRERVLVDVFGGDDEVIGETKDSTKDKERGPVGKGVENVTKDLKPVLDGLKWWRLPFTVDELSRVVDHAVERAYAKEFEKPLVFHTGRLAHLQADFTVRTNMLVANLPPSCQSSLLQNSLAQLSTHPSFRLLPSTLLGPIESRTAQLAHATRALHLSAQRAVFGAFGTSALSIGGSYTLWVTQTLGAIDVPTALAGATLGTLAGVRWGVGAWARARRLWLADCTRVGEGFERDVRSGVECVWERQVSTVPAEACRFLNEVVEKRRAGVCKVEDVIDDLEEVVKSGSRRQLGESGEPQQDGIEESKPPEK